MVCLKISRWTYKRETERVEYPGIGPICCMDSKTIAHRVLRQSAGESTYYTVKAFDVLHNIPVGKIPYFKTFPQKHRIRLHAQEEMIEFFGNLQTIGQDLGAGFFRCHRSVLVNRAHMR